MLQWFAVFEPSKRRQRIVIKLVALVTVLSVVFIFAIMCTNVVFAVKCDSIGKLVKSDGYALMQPGDEMNSTESISMRNTFVRGLVSVSGSNQSSGHVDVRVYGTEVTTDCLFLWAQLIIQTKFHACSCRRVTPTHTSPASSAVRFCCSLSQSRPHVSCGWTGLVRRVSTQQTQLCINL